MKIQYVSLNDFKTNDRGHKTINFDPNLEYDTIMYIAPYAYECDGEYQWISNLFRMNKRRVKIIGIMGINFLPIASRFCNEMIVIDQEIMANANKVRSKSIVEDFENYNPEYFGLRRPKNKKCNNIHKLWRQVRRRPVFILEESRDLFNSISYEYEDIIFVLYKANRYDHVIDKLGNLSRSNMIIDHSWSRTEKIYRSMNGSILSFQILSSVETNTRYIGFAGISNLFCVSPVNSLFLCDYTTTDVGSSFKSVANKEQFGHQTKFFKHSIQRSTRRFGPTPEETDDIIKDIKSILT